MVPIPKFVVFHFCVGSEDILSLPSYDTDVEVEDCGDDASLSAHKYNLPYPSFCANITFTLSADEDKSSWSIR